jgi:hypothetical protein
MHDEYTPPATIIQGEQALHGNGRTESWDPRRSAQLVGPRPTRWLARSPRTRRENIRTTIASLETLLQGTPKAA